MTEKGDHCDFDCIHYLSDYITVYDEEGDLHEIDVSKCELGRIEIENADFCKCYESLT